MPSSAWSRAVRQPLFAAILVIVAVHLPFWFVQTSLFELRPIFSFDLLAVLLVGSLSCRSLPSVILGLWIVDCVQSVATSFHFANAGEFLGTIQFAGLLDWRHFLSGATLPLIIMFVGCALLVWFGLSIVRPPTKTLVPILLVIAALDVANGSTRIPGLARDSVLVTTNIAGSPLWNLLTRLETGGELQNLPPAAWQPPPISYEAAREWMTLKPRSRLLIVLVESMGLPVAPELQGVLLDSLRSTLSPVQWSVNLYPERFIGGTTHGELRVLCGLNGRYQSVRDGRADVEPCLPKKWAANGGAVIALHGFTAKMFDRKLWWPKVGLSSMLFAEDLANGENRCGEAFQGVCDRALVQEAVRRLRQGQSFVYALTLNTHLPLKDGPVDGEVEPICIRNQVPHLSCLIIARQSKLLQILGEGLREAQLQPFVIVAGDHAPPFGGRDDRVAFVKDTVPVFVARPR